MTGRCLEYTVFGFRKVNITARNRSHFPPISTAYSQPQYQILQTARSRPPYCCSSRGGTMDNRPNPIRGPSTCKTDDTMEVTNPAEFLRNERGVFEVISPYGHVFSVTCRFGSRMNIREISEPKSIENQQRLTWKIRRVNSNVA